MQKKTEIEKIIDAIESKEELKKKGEKYLPEFKLNEWNTKVEDSIYTNTHGKELELLIKLQYGLQRGLSIKDAVYITRHRYKDVPINVTKNVMEEFSEYGHSFITNVDNQIKKEVKKRIILKK